MAHPAVTPARVTELLDIVRNAVGDVREDAGIDNLLVVGQRVLLRAIPFVEPLGRDGASRRAVLVALVSAAEEAAGSGTVRTALRGVQRAMDLGADSILVSALQDTEMLARSARGCGACLLSLFQRLFRQHAPGAAAPAPAPVAL
jgi:hypothetical protein